MEELLAAPDALADTLMQEPLSQLAARLSALPRQPFGKLAPLEPENVKDLPLALIRPHAIISQRVALVGDAAHGVHPVAGQGLNLGLRDVAALAEVVVEAARRGEDIGAPDVLERYQRWRRFDATALGLGMDTVNRLFSNDLPVLRQARGLGMGLVTAIAPLRRAFMRQAAGLAVAPMPRLLTGRPL